MTTQYVTDSVCQSYSLTYTNSETSAGSSIIWLVGGRARTAGFDLHARAGQQLGMRDLAHSQYLHHIQSRPEIGTKRQI